MMVLEHFDWLGTREELEKYTAAVKKACEAVGGVEFKGLLSPWNKKYNYTFFFEAKDLKTWLEVPDRLVWTRDYKIVPHEEVDIYA